MARGNKKGVALGPGKLYMGAVGTDEPTDLITAIDTTDWVPLGYTAEGSSMSYEVDTEDVEVAEELDAIDTNETSRSIVVEFALAEVTAANLKRAMNGGTITVVGTTPNEVNEFEPPELGATSHSAILFESEDGKERWVYRVCKQNGSVEMERRKGSDLTTIPCEFRVLKPETGAPFKALISQDRDS